MQRVSGQRNYPTPGPINTSLGGRGRSLVTGNATALGRMTHARHPSGSSNGSICTPKDSNSLRIPPRNGIRQAGMLLGGSVATGAGQPGSADCARVRGQSEGGWGWARNWRLLVSDILASQDPDDRPKVGAHARGSIAGRSAVGVAAAWKAPTSPTAAKGGISIILYSRTEHCCYFCIASLYVCVRT